MKISAWNVNSVKARKDNVLRWLEETKPDIAFLQELKTDGEHYPEAEIAALGYKSEIRGQKGYAGVATLVKDSLDSTLILQHLLPEEDDQARYLEVEINDVRFINIYAPNGNPVGTEKYDYKLNWYKALEDKLHSYMKDEKAFVIGGDFNIIPEPKDCYDAQAWMGDALYAEEMRALYRRLKNYGLTDAFRAFDARAGQYTFWDYQAGCWPQDKGIRIDHFLLAPRMADLLRSCHIDKARRGEDKPSDHTPITVEIDFDQIQRASNAGI